MAWRPYFTAMEGAFFLLIEFSYIRYNLKRKGVRVKLRPLVKRTFKIKKPSISFFCPLCRSPRSLKSSFRLELKNFIQILLLALVTTIALFPVMEFRSIFSFFIYWAVFELVRRANYRKEIPCPHCGFDASWYKKDVLKAKELVERHFKVDEELLMQANSTIDSQEQESSVQ